MISIIISSVNKTMLANVSQNIADTIGVPFEIISIDNSKGERGLCAVYNDGAGRAKYDVLCFMHEDISLKTNNWGQNVISLFKQQPQIGLVGVAGSSYKPLTPAGWIGMGAVATDYINILQGFKHAGGEPELCYRNPNNSKFETVACVDGVWLCTTREVFKKVRFDEHMLQGFHGYDIDFSMAVGRHYTVAVTYEMLLHHFSEGNFESEWFFAMLKINEKWSKHLPVCTEAFTKEQKIKIERITFKTFVEYLIRTGQPAGEAFKVLLRNNRFLVLYPSLFIKLPNFIRKAYRAAKKEGRL